MESKRKGPIVEDWVGFANQGGLQGGFQFLPLKDVVDALARLYDTKRQIKEAIYEISGQSDIMRGESDPRETATAQGIKERFAGIRIQEKQREFQRLCRDVIAHAVRADRRARGSSREGTETEDR